MVNPQEQLKAAAEISPLVMNKSSNRKAAAGNDSSEGQESDKPSGRRGTSGQITKKRPLSARSITRLSVAQGVHHASMEDIRPEDLRGQGRQPKTSRRPNNGIEDMAKEEEVSQQIYYSSRSGTSRSRSHEPRLGTANMGSVTVTLAQQQPNSISRSSRRTPTMNEKVSIKIVNSNDGQQR